MPRISELCNTWMLQVNRPSYGHFSQGEGEGEGEGEGYDLWPSGKVDLTHFGHVGPRRNILDHFGHFFQNLNFFQILTVKSYFNQRPHLAIHGHFGKNGPFWGCSGEGEHVFLVFPHNQMHEEDYKCSGSFGQFLNPGWPSHCLFVCQSKTEY
ncbi:MAG: hypothetical protein GY830_10000 [Bacteroidetes bacterium]|nr:hypothetical protein [Bacteroidota bacterium]